MIDVWPATARLGSRFTRSVCMSSMIVCMQLLACSSSEMGGGGANGSWTCFMKNDLEEPGQCQTSPVGGKQQIVDHCGPEFVQRNGVQTEAECCKDWLWLNGNPVSAYYCSCYAKGSSKTCNVSLGDEVVDRCP